MFTRIPIAVSPNPIGYDSQVLSLGSCFAVNMAEKLGYFQFRQTVNPFGILFQPTAIEKLLERAINDSPFNETDIFYANDRWQCFDVHSDLSHPDATIFLHRLNEALATTRGHLQQASHVIVTLGTAWVYRHKSSGNRVANCHKIPQTEFTKELLPIEAIAESLSRIVSLVSRDNPSAQLIFTVSPVRHLKDGFVENQRSKAHLIAALHTVLDKQSGHQPPVTSHYFPSYEIMMDELRDYRFYADDLLHPSPMAINCIWEKFAASWVSPEVFPVMAEVDAVRKAQSHRPFNPDADSYRKFVQATTEKIAALQVRFPHMAF
ncbi:GSCFA domain-containing protein [Flavobacterium longum]